MKYTEIVDSIKKAGTNISAGFTGQDSTQETFSAQYPAERSAGNDATQASNGDLYKNGLLFTAYDYKARSTPEMTRQRMGQLDQARSIVNRISAGLADVGRSNTVDSNTKKIVKDPVANILLPRSKSDADVVSHKFNDVQDSLITRGGGTATGILSNIASTAVFGTIESVTQGWLADKGEQIFNASRSMYNGAENRSKVYTWELTPRTLDDLVEIMKIYEIFNYYSYGMTGTSAYAKELKTYIDDWYKKTFINNLTPEGSDRSNTAMESVTSFLSNVITVSNPTIWFVRNFGKSTKFDGRPDVFGPAQIQSIRFDKAPDGHFKGLAIAPNMPSTFILEITMREVIALSRGSLYGEEVL